MVYGNMNDSSAVGIVYSANPIDGTPEIFGILNIFLQRWLKLSDPLTGEYMNKAEGIDLMRSRKRISNIVVQKKVIWSVNPLIV